MWILVLALLLVGAHFSLTAIAPAEAGKVSLIWPFAADTHPLMMVFGAYPGAPTQLLSIFAGLAFLAAALALLGWVVPNDWWMPLVLLAVVTSSVLFLMYLGPWAFLPLLVNVVLVWGIFAQHWSVTALRGV